MVKNKGWLIAFSAGSTLVALVSAIFFYYQSSPRQAVRAHPNTPEPTALWVPNAVVSDVLVGTDSYYIAGSFSFLGPYTGAGVPLDATTGDLIEPHAVVSPTFPGVNAIDAVVADGTGGWYIGGAHDEVDGTARTGLSHIRGNGTLDLDFNLGTDGEVFSLLLNGTTLYVGGEFTTLGGQPRSGLGAINLLSGTVTSWDPSVSASTAVYTMALSGTTLFIGGNFTTVDGDTRSRLAAVDTTATVAGTYTTAWDPNLAGGTNTAANELIVDGTTVYVGGDFGTIDGDTRNNIAAIDATATVAGTYTTAWDADADAMVLSIARVGSTIYAGGQFSNIGGAARARLAGLNNTTGAATAFDANVNGTGGNVYTILPSGTDLYIAGDFVTVDTESRPFFAKVDSSGALLGWNPRGCDAVFALAEQSGQIYAGGRFPCVGSVERWGLAELDKATGAPTSWAPSTEFTAFDSITTDGTSIIASGSFTTIGGQPRNNIAAIDPVSGVIGSWDPNSSGRVIDLEYRDGTVYAAGSFTTIGGQPRNRIAALDATTGLATSWDPNANGRVSEIEMSDTTMYVSSGTGFGPGSFTSIGGQSRSRLAELDLTTGLATSWDPSPNTTVQSVATDGTTVYVGGSFSTIGGASRDFLAALDPVTGLATSWNPDPDALVSKVDLDEGILYVGGNFTVLSGESRSLLASFETASGALTPWDPQGLPGGSADNAVKVLQTGSPVLIVGGDFDLPGLGQSNLKLFSLTTVEWATDSLSGPAEPSEVELPVTMSSIEASDVEVSYAATGGTAVQGQDYELDPGTFIVPAGETGGTVPLTILGDGTGQSKTIEVTLSNPSPNALLGDQIVITYTIQGESSDPIVRIPGSTPQEQAIAISEQRFTTPGSAGGAVLARKGIAVDAFTSGPLVNRTDSTLLLTSENQLDQVVIDELDRALQSTSKPIYLAGGEVALEPAVRTQLEQLGYTNITRFDGANRRATARLAAQEVVTKNTVPATKLFLTEGEALADALAVGAVAGRDPLNQQTLPILVTTRTASELDQNVIDFITANPAITEVEIVGGQVAVSAAAEAQLKQLFPALTVTRTAGDDRFLTNVAVVEKYYTSPAAAIVARGDKGGIPGALSVQSASDDTEHFFSALLAGTEAAERQIPLLLVTPTELPTSISGYIQSEPSIDTIFIVGSLDQINQAVEDQLRALLLQPQD